MSDGLNSYCKECSKKSTIETAQKYRKVNVKLSHDFIRFQTPIKKCYKCKLEKYSDHFNIDITKKSGLSTQCRECANKMIIQYRKDRPGNQKRLNKEYYLNNIEKIKKDTGCYAKKNHHWLKVKAQNRVRERRRSDPQYRFRIYLSDMIRKYLRKDGFVKDNKTEHYLGCKIQDFKAYITELFTEGMSWNNYGQMGWHLDHKRPAASFDLSIEEDRMACFHYTNFQPLWRKDNIAKNSFYNGKRYFHADKKYKEGN